MNKRLTRFTCGCLMLAVWSGLAPWTATSAQEKGGTQIQDLAGEWKITYDNGVVHVYTIDKDGKMRGNVGEAKWIEAYTLTGKIERREGRMLLMFKDIDLL